MRRISVWVAVFVASAVAVLVLPALREPPQDGTGTRPPEATGRIFTPPEPGRSPEIRQPVPAARTPHDFNDRTVDQLLTDLAAALRAEDRELARAILEALRERMVPPPIADEDNAALLYQQAFTLIDGLNLTDAEQELLKKEPPLSDEELAAARALWERCGPAVTLLTEGASRPACRFPLDYADGFDMELPHIDQAIMAARVLRLGSVLGEATAVPALRLGQDFRGDGVLTSGLVAAVINRISAAGIQRSGGPELEALIDRLDPAAGREDFRRAMVFETVSAIDLLLNKSPEEVAQLLDQPIPQSPHLSGHVEWMQGVIWLTERPYHEVRERLAMLEKEAEASLTITRLLTPALSRSMLVQATDEAITSLMKLGLALERYRSAQGRYPESLGALGIPIPLDPVTGLPYIYAPDGAGYLLANQATEKDERVEWRGVTR